MQFARRMDQFGEGIFSRLLEKKKKKVENGETIIDLSVGTPNIPPAQHIMDALCTAAADPKNYIYAVNDQTALLEAVSSWYDTRYGVTLDPKTEIRKHKKKQEGLAHIALSIVDEGDVFFFVCLFLSHIGQL